MNVLAWLTINPLRPCACARGTRARHALAPGAIPPWLVPSLSVKRSGRLKIIFHRAPAHAKHIGNRPTGTNRTGPKYRNMHAPTPRRRAATHAHDAGRGHHTLSHRQERRQGSPRLSRTPQHGLTRHSLTKKPPIAATAGRPASPRDRLLLGHRPPPPGPVHGKNTDPRRDGDHVERFAAVCRAPPPYPNSCAQRRKKMVN